MQHTQMALANPHNTQTCLVYMHFMHLPPLVVPRHVVKHGLRTVVKCNQGHLIEQPLVTAHSFGFAVVELA